MKVSHSNYSYRSCDDLPSLFKKMFPGNVVAENFTMSKSKVSYLISDGLGPYFRSDLCSKVSASPGYVIQYDETANSQIRKQCDILVRYWSEDKGQVVVHFLKAAMFGHATGEDVANSILETLQETGYQLPLDKLLNLGSDGPNVNKTIWNKVNEHVQTKGLPGLLPFIPCNMHVVHNSFREGLKVYGQEAEELAIDIFYFFKHSPCKREDFLEVEASLGFDEELFIRHVESRWLSLLPALERIVKNWEPLVQYFLTTLPKTAAASRTLRMLESNIRYNRICRMLKSPTTLIQINFLLSLSTLYDRFLRLFQREDPLVHILHSEMMNLQRSFMLRFLKGTVVDELKTGKKLKEFNIESSDSQRSDLEVGQSTQKIIDKKPDLANKEVMSMRKFYQTVTKYLQKRLPLDNEMLQNLKCLHPLEQKSERGTSKIRRIAESVPQVVEESSISQVTDEWKMYQLQDITDSLKIDDTQKDIRVDDYWNRVLQSKSCDGSPKYKVLGPLVKAVLCFAHGNAEVERSLSENKKMLSKERTLLSDSSINGLRMVKDAVKVSPGGVADINITKGLLEAGRKAHALYKRRIEEEEIERQQAKKARLESEAEQKRLEESRKELEGRKLSLKEKEKAMIKLDKQLGQDLQSAEKLFGEANERLKKAIKKKDFDEAGIAQGLIDVASKKMKETREQMKKNRKSKGELAAKQKRLIEDLSKGISAPAKSDKKK